MKLRFSPSLRFSQTSLHIALGAIGCFAVNSLSADVRMPAIFGDHMVLQQDANIPIWGWAEPGENVTVSIGQDKASAVTGPDGKWSIKLNKLAVSDKPIEVTISGKNTITLRDVLVGDVWVCSGQSNMEFGIKAFFPKDDLAKAGEPQIRLFSVPKAVKPLPSEDIGEVPKGFPNIGKWQVCTPETLASSGEWSGFPAVGYFFGREIHNYTHQPVGLIGTTWGGTRINSWISLNAMEAASSMTSYANGARKFRDDYEEIKTRYENETLPQWKTELAAWLEENKAAIELYNTETKAWGQKAKDAAAQNLPAPPRPVAPKPPREPRDPIHDNQTSAALFNGMVAPIIPFAIKGAIWYQGESNGDQPAFYSNALPILISDWRATWSQGDFPFLIVQLPNFMARKPAPSESNWAGVREAQALALKLPNTGVAVTIDIGDAGNIHPPDKYDVGYRLALAAQRVAYGNQEVVHSGPTYKSSTIEGDKIRIDFDHVGGGLTIGTPPEHFYKSQKQQTPPAPATELQGFAIAGEDHKYVWAKASIDGHSVVVSSPEVTHPMTVRYAWADNPACNLYNKEGLPAAPFRTDGLPLGK